MPTISPSPDESKPESPTTDVPLDTGFRTSALYRKAKRIVILIVGITVLLLGIALIVLPGPAVIVIPAGLSILAIEFAWARRWLKRMKAIWETTRKRFTD